MNTAGRVQIAKLKISRDKFGRKLCKIELHRTLLAMDTRNFDSLTPSVMAALTHMGGNPKCTQVKLGLECKSLALNFYASGDESHPSERFPNVIAVDFRLKRKEEEIVVLSFSFLVPLEDARRWIIPSIGDEILCVTEDAQLSFSDGESK